MKLKRQKFFLERREINVHVTAHPVGYADALHSAIQIVKKDWDATARKEWFQDVFPHMVPVMQRLFSYNFNNNLT